MIRRFLLLASLALAACGGPAGSPYERGAAAFRRGDIRTARVELMNALQANPGDRAARMMQARVQLALGDGIAAESEIARARQSGVPAEETRHLLAHARLLQNDPRGALAEAAVVPAAHEAYAARMRGRALLALHDLAAAQAQLDYAASLAPRDSAVWIDLARYRRAAGNIAGALEAVDRALALRPGDAEALVLRGELSRGQYGLSAALPWFDRALDVDPGHVPALLERAITYGDLGRMGDMLSDVRAVHALTGGHPTAYYLQAVLAARARNFELARSLYNRTRGAFDSVPAGMLLGGTIDLETGNAAQAADRLAALVARQPANRKARRLLAVAQWRMGDLIAAAETLRPIVDGPDADDYALTLMGRLLARRGDAAAAAHYLARAALPQPGALTRLDPLADGEFADLRAAADARPGDGPIQVRLVSALLARGLRDEALERAQRIQTANPGAPETHVLVGDVLGTGGDFAGAAEQYRRAANLAFTEPVALRLIEALQRSGQVPAADQVLELYVQQNPRSVPGQILLASRMMQRREYGEAILVYESLRSRLGNNDATILNNLAWAYSETGDYDSAVPLARRAWALDRNNPATADTLGWILFKSGEDPAGGLALLARATRGAPSEEAIRRQLEQAGTAGP
ncbi:tetratricopeptide repeat protein [Sphingosinicella sp. CPCC 101087]|uniref:tetratricopeptide repeat protein n=1 Tax=Sphingosinicella sp. CPCC 101087 TaxID=2497754 RepID=UPI00101D2D80|nr:tetratricopeptide repeat protein [Sphingosinicella sp. CPCC 101087]